MLTWDSFDRFENEIDAYMPPRGEGDSLASQTATAVNKLIYKWFNDGDVYDNNYKLKGWANDLSSYANWLFGHAISPQVQSILWGIRSCETEDEYVELLYDLASVCLDPKLLEKLDTKPVEDSIYDYDGPFSFREYDEDEYEDDDEDDVIYRVYGIDENGDEEPIDSFDNEFEAVDFAKDLFYDDDTEYVGFSVVMDDVSNGYTEEVWRYE